MSTSVSDRCCDFDQSDMGNREQVKHPGVSSNYRLLLYYCSKKLFTAKTSFPSPSFLTRSTSSYLVCILSTTRVLEYVWYGYESVYY